MNNKLVENRQSEMKATVVNEQQKENKIKIDEKNVQATKFNEDERTSATTVNQIDPFAPDVTNINEGEKEEDDQENVAKLKNNKSKDVGQPEDEVYWKEADVIDTMWKDWFIAFFNYATNKAVHAIEYGFDAAYYAYKNRSRGHAEAEAPKEDKPKNNTEKLHREVSRSQKNSSQDLDNLVKDNDKLLQMLQEGKIDEAAGQNAALGRFFNTFPEIKAKINPNNPDIELASKAAVALTKNIEIFSENYAQSKIMTDQMVDKNRYKDMVDNPEQVSALYKQEKSNAYSILLKEIGQRMTNENLTLDQAIVAINKDMDKSAEITRKNFKDGNYSDNGRIPQENPYLDHLTGLIAQNDTHTETREQPQAETETPSPKDTKEETHSDTEDKNRRENPEPEKEEKHDDYTAPKTPKSKTEEALDEIINSDKYTEEEKDIALDLAIKDEKRSKMSQVELSLDDIINSNKYTEEEKEIALDMAIEEENRNKAADKNKPRSMAEEAASLEASPLQKKYDFFMQQEQQLESRAYDYGERRNNLQKFKQNLLGGLDSEKQKGGNDNFIAPTYGVEKPKEEKAAPTSGAPYSIDFLRGKIQSR